MNNIGVSCKMGLRRCRKHVGDRGVEIITFDEYSESEIDEEWSDERSMKFFSSKCNEVVNRHASGLSISIFELQIIKLSNLTF
jgi:hypothetical protein